MNILKMLAGGYPIMFSNGIELIGYRVATSVSAAITCQVPNGSQAGDLIIAVSNQLGSTTVYTMTPPAGWTETLDSNGQFAGYLPSYDGTTASYTFTKSNITSQPQIILITFRKAAFDVQGAISATSATPVAPAITLSAASSTVIACFCNLQASTLDDRTYTTPTNYTLIRDTGKSLAVFYRSDLAAGSTGTVTSTASTGVLNRGYLIGLKPQISFTFVASANADADTISYPAGTQVGDLLVFFDGASSFATGTFAYPTGWTGIANSIINITGDTVVASSYLVTASATGTVKGNYTTSTGTGQRRKIIAVFRPSNPIATVSLSSTISSVMAASSPASQNINATLATSPAICIAHGRRFGSIPTTSPTWPQQLTTIFGSGAGHQAGYDIQNGAKTSKTIETIGFGTEYSGMQSYYITAS